MTQAGKGMRGAGTDLRGQQKTLEALEAEGVWGCPPRNTKSSRVGKHDTQLGSITGTMRQGAGKHV